MCIAGGDKWGKYLMVILSTLLPPWMCFYVDEVSAHTHTHRRIHIHTHAHAHTNTQTYTHTYTHIYTHIHAHTHTHTDTIHTHTHTHTHIHICTYSVRLEAFVTRATVTGGVCDTSDGALLSPIFDDFGQLWSTSGWRSK